MTRHIIVVGRGMIGSAAARHLAESGHQVTLIGPSEPPEPRTWDGPVASHHDQGRVTRIMDPMRIKSIVARRSLDRHEALAQATGITFHTPVGVVYSSNAVEPAVTHGVESGASVHWTTADAVHQRWGIDIGSTGHRVAFEDAPAGLIHPRLLVAAQTKAAQMAGAMVIDDVVVDVTTSPATGQVTTSTGSRHQGDTVLLATGPHAARPAGHDLATISALRTFVTIEFDIDAATAGALPSLIVGDVGHSRLHGVYWVPPVRYPDGRVMLKIGADAVPAQYATTDAELTDWFQSGGSADEAADLFDVATAMLPGLAVRSWDFGPCTTTWTRNALPYLGWLDDRIAVAVGGNGGAAKSSDEWGRLAAEMVTSPEWSDDDFDVNELAPVFGPYGPVATDHEF